LCFVKTLLFDDFLCLQRLSLDTVFISPTARLYLKVTQRRMHLEWKWCSWLMFLPGISASATIALKSRPWTRAPTKVIYSIVSSTTSPIPQYLSFSKIRAFTPRIWYHLNRLQSLWSCHIYFFCSLPTFTFIFISVRLTLCFSKVFGWFPPCLFWPFMYRGPFTLQFKRNKWNSWKKYSFTHTLWIVHAYEIVLMSTLNVSFKYHLSVSCLRVVRSTDTLALKRCALHFWAQKRPL